ncbi:cytochrome P450 [Stachybotrys elegans]|uniref:Cytochrome P450 n=1 Tax=Stachybotrys elegans TaxID=80388 RepID=A0A8K0SR64_9HYPO|nr:cytochrome P450 [Stachybotrys elegans]
MAHQDSQLLSHFAGRFAAALAFGVAAVLILVQVIYRTTIGRNANSPLRSLPGPNNHHILVGQSINQLLAGSPEEPYKTWSRQWPQAKAIRFLGMGHTECLLVNSLDFYREVLTQSSSVMKPTYAFRKALLAIIGDGLALASGEAHTKQRNEVGGFLQTSNVRKFYPLTKTLALERAEELGADESTGSGDEYLVEVKKAASIFALRVIGVFGFGLDLQHFDPSNTILECYEDIFDPTSSGLVLQAIDTLIPVRWLPLKANKVLSEATGRLRALITTIVRERIANLSGEVLDDKEWNSMASDRDDLLTFIARKQLQSGRSHNEIEAYLVEQGMHYLATGHETTATALAWAMRALATHPDITLRLRQGLKTLPEEPSFDDVSNHRLLDCFIKELLRVHCPVAGIPRQTTADIPSKALNLVIPKGTVIVPVPAVLSMHPAIWGDDADEFHLERWDTLDGTPAADPQAWAAFGYGPRGCLGKPLAMMSLKVAVLEMVKKFDFHLDTASAVTMVHPNYHNRMLDSYKVRLSRVKGDLL